jgi:hypothetical protein
VSGPYINPVNIICYSLNCLRTIEEIIKELDMFKALVFGVENAKNRILHFNKYKNKELNEYQEKKIFEKEIKKKINERNSFWGEIEDGISRLLNGDKHIAMAYVLSEDDITREGMLLTNNSLILHGHQLQEWRKNKQYWFWKNTKPKLVCLGHYHIMLPMVRYDTIILFNGHFKSEHETDFKNHYLSHMGTCAYSACANGELREVDIMRS